MYSINYHEKHKEYEEKKYKKVRGTLNRSTATPVVLFNKIEQV